MPADPAQPPRSRSRAPRVVLGLTLVFTALATWLVSVTSRERQRENFERDAEVVRLHIASRLETYVSLLRGGTGFLAANREVSRQEFATYVSQLKVAEFYPGIQGVGYAERVGPEEREALSARLRMEGFPEFFIRPEGEREGYFPIVLLEPPDRRNRAAIGFDMYSEPARRTAMDRARDTGAPIATGRVTLVQEIDEEKQPGFLIYVPVYAGGETPPSVEARRAALQGFVYAPFRSHDFFRTVLAAMPISQIGLEVYDGGGVAPERLIFAAAPDGRTPRRLAHTAAVAAADHVWTLHFWGDAELGLAAPHIIIPFVAGSGVVLGLVLFAATRRLVQAREAAEQSAREAEHSRRLFERIAAATPDVLSVFDLAQGRFIYVNRDASKALGYTPEQVQEIGARWLADFVHPEDQAVVRESLERLATLPDGEVQVNEIRFRRADGEYRWMLSRSVVFTRLPDGRVHHVLGLSTDITERRATEEALRAANEAKDHFLAALSHELRTPLTPVLAVVSTLESDLRLDEEVRRELSMVRRNIELEARLIDDLLDLTRITRGKLSLNLAPVDLKRLVDDCAATVMELRGKRIDFAMEWGAEESWVSGDRSRLMQVFWNVLKNAAKFTPAGGQVTVRASQRNGDGTGTGPWLAVECEDTGVGIAPEVLPQIFTAFEQGGPGITRQFGGLGLGLAISRALVEAHGGSIRAQSEGLGKGATFTVCLPAVPTPERGGESPAPAAPAMQANAKSENGSSALHILLVEDHADTAEILSRRLRRLGHKVTHAESVAQALACAADAQAGRNGGRIDLVVSDLGLPDGTGYDLMRQLSAEHGLRGIAVSGFGMEEDLRRSAEAGFARHFTKPVDFARLAGIIQELAEGRDG